MDHRKTKRIPEKKKKNVYFFIANIEAFDSVDHTTYGRFLRWEYQMPLLASWENCMQIKKQQLELDMEQKTGSKLGKEYIKLYTVTLLI